MDGRGGRSRREQSIIRHRVSFVLSNLVDYPVIARAAIAEDRSDDVFPVAQVVASGTDDRDGPRIPREWNHQHFRVFPTAVTEIAELTQCSCGAVAGAGPALASACVSLKSRRVLVE